MPNDSDVPKSRRPRWYVPTLAKFLFGVLVMQGVLYLSAHYRWFWFNERKGYTVLITVAATAIALLLLVGFVVASRFFKAKAQFGLSTLLLMVPVTGVPCAWLAREIELARRQRDALAWINAGRGYGHLSRVVISIGLVERRKPPQSRFFDFAEDRLSAWLGDDFFDDVTAISISKPDALERVHLLRQLKYIGCRSPIEIDLAHLRGLNHLQTLDLDYCQIIGTRLEPLRNLPALQKLSLIGTNVTDGDLEVLTHLKQLKELSLGLTAVTDAGLKHVAGVTQLTMLHLPRTPITNEGLKQLKGLSGLRMLELIGCDVTAEGVEQLEDALPKCQISHR